MTVTELPKAWRDRAEQLRPYSPAAAEAFSNAATDLELALKAHHLEELTRAEACAEFVVHPDTLTRLAREGRLTNRGRPHAPRYRRGDLVALGFAPREQPDPDPVGAAASSVSSLDSFTRRVHAKGRR